MRNRLIATERKRSTEHAGLAVHADEGIHDQAFRLLMEWHRPPGRVLDVGAGTGAFAVRLAKAGYDVTAVDIDADQWAAPEVRFVTADVDEGLGCFPGSSFDVACAIEVIEHLESPWVLFRELHRIVVPGGYLVLSTPNVSSFLSRWLFLRRGRFHQFDEEDLSYGHITPLSSFQLEMMASRTGWEIVVKSPAGYLPVLDLTHLSLRTIAHNVFRLLAYLLARGDKEGWCLLFLFRRKS